MKLEVISNSIKETQLFASKFSKKIKNGTIIALIGDLGSGKTTFTQGFAEGLGINQHIGSPTFKLVSEYKGLKYKLYHADCYRLKNANEFLNFGGENLLIPTTPDLPFKLENNLKDPLKMYLSDLFTVPINLAGIPSINVPVGYSSNNLPIGLQIVSNSFKEETLFSLAHILNEEEIFEKA